MCHTQLMVSPPLLLFSSFLFPFVSFRFFSFLFSSFIFLPISFCPSVGAYPVNFGLAEGCNSVFWPWCWLHVDLAEKPCRQSFGKRIEGVLYLLLVIVMMMRCFYVLLALAFPVPFPTFLPLSFLLVEGRMVILMVAICRALCFSFFLLFFFFVIIFFVLLLLLFRLSTLF